MKHTAPIILLAAASTLAAAQTYTLIDLGTLHGESEAFAIGQGGQIVGSSTGVDSHFDAVAFAATPSPLPMLAGRSEHVAFGVSNSGVVFGAAYSLGDLDATAFTVDAGSVVPLGAFTPRDANSAGQFAGTTNTTLAGLVLPRACRANASSIETLPTLGGLCSSGSSIDALGRVVGNATTTAEDGPRPTLWIGAQAFNLGTLGGTQGSAQAIRSGVVVGYSQLAGGLRTATKWTIDAAGAVLTRTNLGALHANTTSFALGLNSSGDIVGTSAFHAVLWRNGGAPADLNTLVSAPQGWVLEKAWAINDAGHIVGRATVYGVPRAFELVPACVADLDNGTMTGVPDGGVDINDLLYFLQLFEAGHVRADLDNGTMTGVHDGGVDINDLLYFLARFEVGC